MILLGALWPVLVGAQGLEKIEGDGKAMTIRSIQIDNGNIFDMQDDRENAIFYRAVNALHFKTRRNTIVEQLLFKVGDPYVPRLIVESERLLRANRYIGEVIISPKIEGSFVDVAIFTKDTWSTKPKINFSQSGGESKSEFGIKEENLLGLGISADLSYKADADRKSYVTEISDSHLWGTWYSLDMGYTSSSDGFEKKVALQKPFYSMDALSSYGLIYDSHKFSDAYYLLGNKYYQYGALHNLYEIFGGWSAGLEGGSVTRHKIGLRLEEEQYSELEHPRRIYSPVMDPYLLSHDLLPADRKDIYPFYGVEYLQDRYMEVRNFEHIGKVEDRYMGLGGRFEVGYASEGFGSYEDRVLFKAAIGKTIELDAVSSISSEADLNLRLGNSSAENVLGSVQLKYYREQGSHFKFYSDLAVVAGHDLDIQNQIFLGNETGLRGFPMHYLSGDNMEKITLEERYYSDAKPFRIFGFGAALFLDVGRIAGGNDIEREHSGVYSSAGLGLRIANNRSARGDILHIDFAFPIGGDAPDTGFQINLQLKPTF